MADQSSDGKTITVDAVNITGASGFIAVHADADGTPGPVVGHAAIPEGDSSKVVITLDAPVTTGSFWPMLHLDAGTIGTYEFPGPDGPVKSGVRHRDEEDHPHGLDDQMTSVERCAGARSARQHFLVEVDA